MKKLFLLMAAATFTFVSCKKDRTCICTSTVNGQVVQIVPTTIKDTKKKAKEVCEKLSISITTTAGTTTSTCVLQ